MLTNISAGFQCPLRTSITIKLKIDSSMEVEQAFGTGQQKQHQSKFCLKLMLIDSRMAKRTGIAFACSTRNQRSWYVVFERVRRERPRAARARLVPLYLQSAAHQAVQHWHILQLIFNHNHHFHHKLINSHCWDFPYELHMGKMCYSPPRGSNADWWLSTIANAARTNVPSAARRSSI
jgi:hypothetical protein